MRSPGEPAAVFKPAITLTRALVEPKLFGQIFAAPSFWT
jgi:hypothetical protein